MHLDCKHVLHSWTRVIGDACVGAEVPERGQGSIDSLYLHTGHMAHFTKMPDKVLQELAHLHLIMNKCELDSRALDLLTGVLPTMTSLKRLDIRNNPPADGGTYQPTGSGTVKLLQSLANIHLHTLNMYRIPMGHDDIVSLSHLIRPPGGLKELTVGDEHMQPDCVELLLKAVLSPSSLQTLTLKHMKMDDSSFSFSPLKDDCNITWLVLDLRTIGSQDISSIAEALHSNTTLEELRLRSIIMSDTNEVNTNSAVRDLADALKVNRSLKLLFL